MSDTYAHRPVTITGEKPPTAAELDHQRWANREPPVIDHMRPTVYTLRTPPSQAEMDAARLARRRPADRSARAIQVALDAVVTDLASANSTLVHYQDASTQALQSGAAPAAVKAARDNLELAQIEVEQLGMMEAGLRVSLEKAQRDEAAEHAAFVASLLPAQAAVDAFTKFITKDYPALAAKLAAGLALEPAAEAAHRTLLAAATSLPDHEAPAPLPRVKNGTQEEAYRHRASLPGTDVKPLARWAPPVTAVQF